MAYNFALFKQSLAGIEERLKKEFASIRTGRASPVVLDIISVDSYGSRMSIRELASISVEDPKTIRIAPWDKTQTKNIETAIQAANLGLSAVPDDRGLRVIFPELTSERRIALTRLLKQKHEETRIALRLERDRVWEEIQTMERRSGITEDEKFRFKSEMQKIVDETNKRFDELAERKEKEILQ
ncbi:ribosome recycling factor [Patescibacteria group bacterium]|nr:MAG: ribosome recycling factor [Patescibacteria group bacterium]